MEAESKVISLTIIKQLEVYKKKKVWLEFTRLIFSDKKGKNLYHNLLEHVKHNRGTILWDKNKEHKSHIARLRNIGYYSDYKKLTEF